MSTVPTQLGRPCRADCLSKNGGAAPPFLKKKYLLNFGPNFVSLFLLSGDDLGKLTMYRGVRAGWAQWARAHPLFAEI